MLRLLVPVLLASVGLAQSYFAASLDGAQEVPAVAGPGRGWGVVRLDAATNSVRVFVTHELLSGAPTTAHLHLGAVGGTGGPIVTLTPASANSYSGSGSLTPAEVASLIAGGTYLNVHTALNGAGEIRGQVVPSASIRFTGVLSGAQELPPNASTASGTAVAYLHEPENRVVYVVDSVGLANVTVAHFHQGVVGTSGPPFVTLNGSNGAYCGVSDRLTAAQVAAWKADGVYVNIHTATAAAGEIRAQMLKDAGDHWVAVIDGAQTVPPTGATGSGRASLIVGPDGSLVLTGAFSGLSGPATVAHVHLGAIGVAGGAVFPVAIAGTTLNANFTPSASDLANLRAGNWFVNVHTAANPVEEIRGQFGPASLPTTFGEGCLGSNGVRPQIGATGFASIGSSMSVDLYGALPGGAALFAFGASRDNLGPTPFLPVDLTTLGVNAPTCVLLVDPVGVLMVSLDALGCGSQTVNVPFVPSIRGSVLFAQCFNFDVAANPDGFVGSSALTLSLQ